MGGVEDTVQNPRKDFSTVVLEALREGGREGGREGKREQEGERNGGK